MAYRILFIFLSFSLAIQGQTADTLRRIDELFAEWHNATPGVAVAVERNGQVIYNRAFGLANLEYGVPNRTETIFEAGSVSKQVTAAAILLLAKEGKLSLEDDVRKYVPELPVYDKTITINHLLTHTSGLKDWGAVYGLTGWPRTTRVYTLELGFDIVFRQQSLNFTPGTQYSYSNSNYVMLVLITQRVSGMNFANFCNERLFQPLEMHDTQWRDNHRSIVPGRATAYSGSEGRFLLNMPFENLHGPGGLLTTTADMLKWNALLKDERFFGRELSEIRIKPGTITGGRSIGYAAGLQIGSVNGYHEIAHSGATGGYRAWLAYYPEADIAVVLLSNSASFNPTGIGRAIATIFLGSGTAAPRIPPAQPQFVTPALQSLTRFTGIFFNEENNDIITINERNGNLFSGNQQLRAVTGDTLWSNGVKYTLARNNDLQQISQTGAVNLYKRVEEVKNDMATLNSIAGEYYSYDADVIYRIVVREGELWIERKAGDSFRLTPAFYDAYRSGGTFYKFQRDRKGNVTGFDVSVSRASNVPFRRSAR